MSPELEQLLSRAAALSPPQDIRQRPPPFLIPGMTPGSQFEPELEALEMPPQFPALEPSFLDRLGLAFQALQHQPSNSPFASALQGLMQGFGAARGGGFRRAEAGREQENQRLSESARMMAQQRWQQQRARAANVAAFQKAQADQAKANAEARRFEVTHEQTPAGKWVPAQKPQTPEQAAREQRAIEAAERSVRAAERQNRLGEVSTVSKLVDDYRMDQDIKAFSTTRRNMQTIRNSARLRTGQGDLAIVFAYMRSLEPENPSVVREGEYKTAAEAIGKLPALANTPRAWLKGDKLTEAGRQGFIRASQTLLNARRPDYELARGDFRRRATAFGVDPALVLRDYDEPRSEDEEYERFLEITGRTPGLAR